MQVKEFKVFTWDRILIYGGVVGFTLTCSILGLIHGAIPAPGLIVMGLANLGLIIPTCILFNDRNTFKKAIVGYTTNGTAVVGNGIVGRSDSPKRATNFVDEISKAEDFVVSFWATAKSISTNSFTDYLNGGFCGFTPMLIDLAQHDATGSRLVTDSLTRFAVGLTIDKSCTVEFTDTDKWDQVIARIKHETGHKCLNALGVPFNQQHPVMAANKFGF